MMLTICLLALAPSLACDDADDDAYASLEAEALPEQFACGDLTAVAAAPDGSEALLIGIEDGLAAAAHESEQAIVAHYVLPDPRLTVRWVTGQNVFQGQCGRDTGEAWQLDERRDAVSGHVEVTVVADHDGHLSLHAELEELELGHDLQLWAHTIDASID